MSVDHYVVVVSLVVIVIGVGQSLYWAYEYFRDKRFDKKGNK